MPVSSSMPDDVIVLHDALQQIRDIFGTPAEWHFSPSLERVKSSIGRPVVVRRTKRGGVIPQKLRHCFAFSAGPYSQMLSGRTDYPYRRSATHGAGR